jgi:hypothetical protein
LRYAGLTLATAVILAAATAACGAPRYRNITNVPFNTVSDGPQSVLIVDVADPSDSAAVAQQVAAAMRRTMGTSSVLRRQIEYANRGKGIRLNPDLRISRAVMLAQGGELVRPDAALHKISRAANEIHSFTYSGFSTEERQWISDQFVSNAYNAAKALYGNPAYDIDEVNVILDGAIDDSHSFAGGYYNASLNEIHIPPSGDKDMMQLDFLLLMLFAFHDEAMLSYDAFENGMARAAAVIIKKQLNPNFIFDLYTHYYLMQIYDLLNQPALGNSTFFPASGWDGMLIWRLATCASPWLKCYTENNAFFRDFNTRYYAAYKANPQIAGNVPALRPLLAQVVPQVEGTPFNDWFPKQQVLNTADTPGPKLFVYNAPTYPDDPDLDGYGLNIIVQYYTSDGSGDETPLNGKCYPVYWDYQYSFPDLTIGDQYEEIPIADGIGAVGPVFFIPTTVDPAQRVAIDLTIGVTTQRIYFPAGYSGTTADYNDFFGVVLGADMGTLEVQFQGGSPLQTTVGAGGFAYNTTSQLTGLPGFSKTMITCDDGIAPRTIQLNTGFDFYVAWLPFQYTGGSVAMTIPEGVAMVSLPVTAYRADNAAALGVDASTLLMARWRPDILGDNKYEHYPKCPPITAGYGFWTKFDSATQVTVYGETVDPASVGRVGLFPGWNQIGVPFDSDYSIGDIVVEVGNGDRYLYADAVLEGIIGNAFWGYDTPSGTFAVEASTLRAERGYLIRCYQPAGAVLIFTGPEHAGRGRSRTPMDPDPGAWSVTIEARFGDGGCGTAVLGRSPRAQDGFDAVHDTLRPPPFGAYGARGLIFPHTDWKVEPGDYAVDIRSDAGSEKVWDVEVVGAAPESEVTLTWRNLARAPKEAVLILEDTETGTRRFLRTTSSYRFKVGPEGSRSFQVTARTDPAGGRVMITDLVAHPSRGAVSISYGLTRGADTDVQIQSLNGRLVRRIVSRAGSDAGVNTVNWDQRDSAGRRVPRGMYIVQVTARTPEGEYARAVAPLTIGR